MKRICMSFAGLALFLLFSLPAASAQGWGHGGGGGGYGACPGMKGGPGMGPGMMGGYGSGMRPYSALNLNDEQRTQVSQIQEQLRKQHWQMMGQMHEESIKLRNMMAQEKPDAAAVGKQQMKVADIHRQMLESRVEAQNRINALLTPEQRSQIRNYGPGWMTDEE